MKGRSREKKGDRAVRPDKKISSDKRKGQKIEDARVGLLEQKKWSLELQKMELSNKKPGLKTSAGALCQRKKGKGSAGGLLCKRKNWQGEREVEGRQDSHNLF